MPISTSANNKRPPSNGRPLVMTSSAVIVADITQYIQCVADITGKKTAMQERILHILFSQIITFD